MSNLNIIKSYCTKNRCYQDNVKRTPIGIQIHTIGTAQGTAQAVRDYWDSPNVSALVTYVVDCDTAGKVLQLLPEDTYSWADGGYGNRNLITIEICESDFMRYTGGANYDILDRSKFVTDILRGYETAVLLCANICKRYNWDPKKKLSSGLFLISSHDEGRLAGLSTAHVDPSHIWPKVGLSMDTFRTAVTNVMSKGTVTIMEKSVYYYRVRKDWNDPKSQLGAYEVLENAKIACPVGYSVFDEEGKMVYSNLAKTKGTQAVEFANLTESEAADKILELVHKTDNSGILNSVTAAQMILESGYCKTELAKTANNCFGMKAKLSNNTWEGSTWDQSSQVPIYTREVYNVVETWVTANFRWYPCIENSIKDHAAYLLGAMNGTKKRYAGLTNAKNYREAITIIKNGGYATDPEYVDKVCSIIVRFGLDKYDQVKSPTKEYYRVAEDYKNGKYVGQYGAYTIIENAVNKAKELRLCVFAPDGSVYKDFREAPRDILNACSIMNQMVEWDIKEGRQWKYNNANLSSTFEETREAGNLKCNCACMVKWALKMAGILPENAAGFYGKKGGTIVYKSAATKKALLEAYDVIEIGGKKTVNQLLKSGEIQAGDIVTYFDMNHTNVYAGNGYWYDAGHAYMGGTGNVPYKTWYGKTVYGSQKVGCILKRKS